ncbi:hypothetical protein ACWDUM_09860 [Rhodococcus sp. NPDC003322]
MVAEGDDTLRPPFTPEQLADLHGDVLPADVSDRMRTAVAHDPEARATLTALDRVRAELGALRTDPAPAPPAPDDVIARLHAALDDATAAGDPASTVAPRTRRFDPVRVAAAAAAALVVFAAGTIGFSRIVADDPDTAPGTTALADPPGTVQLGDDLRPDTALAMLGHTALGSLSDPGQRAECLRANGIDPTTALLGSGPVRLRGAAGVLLLFAGPRPPQITALVVRSSCSADDPATLARADIG